MLRLESAALLLALGSRNTLLIHHAVAAVMVTTVSGTKTASRASGVCAGFNGVEHFNLFGR